MGGDCSTHAWHVPEQREPGVLYMHGHPGTDYAAVTAIEVDGQRFERVRECELEPSFIEPSLLGFMQEYLCSECGEYSYMQIACDGDGVNYCSICGAKVVRADD